MNDAPSSSNSSSLPAATQLITPGAENAIVQTATPLLDGILRDAAGNPSSMRLVMLLGWSVALGVWAWLSLQAHALQPLPGSIVSILAILTGGKLVQNTQEPVATPASLSPKANGAQGDPATGFPYSPLETKPTEAAAQ